MKPRRPTKVLLPLGLMLLAAWIASNNWGFRVEWDIRSVWTNFKLNSELGVLRVSITMQQEAAGMTYLYGYEYGGNLRFDPFRTALVPRFEHFRFLNSSGFRDEYELSVPYWYLVNSVALVWLVLWWRSRRRDAVAAEIAKPQAAGELNL